VAEAERKRILERTNEGRLVAMAAGVRFGRKPHLKSDTALTLIYQKLPARVVMEKTGISRATYFRLKKRIEAAIPALSPQFLPERSGSQCAGPFP